MKLRFLTLAQQEVDETVLWFEERQEGTGVEFLDSLDEVVRFITTYPLAAGEIEPEIRRCLFGRFPYALIYGIEDETIVVIAVAHTHREPNYWAVCCNNLLPAGGFVAEALVVDVAGKAGRKVQVVADDVFEMYAGCVCVGEERH